MRIYTPLFWVVTVTLWLAPSAWPATEQVLYRFSGKTDGATPSSGLIADAAGNLYGTTLSGGNPQYCSNYSIPGCGVVFELSLTSGGQWQEQVLFSFNGTDGNRPLGNLLFDAAGNLYGTTEWGGNGSNCGSVGCGTVFELSPTGNGTWTENVLYSFQGSDGASPSGLTLDAAGNLYGMTSGGGGVSNSGLVYELSPPQTKGGAWTRKTLYTFLPNGTVPNGPLVFDKNGNLYGTRSQSYDCYLNCGSVFELTPAGNNWDYTSIYQFQGGGNGGEPVGGVIIDGDGDFFGAGAEGGNNWGIAFHLFQKDGQWNESMLHNFCSKNNCADGAGFSVSLTFGPAGTLYGVTTGGGGECPFPGCGTVFQLTHTRVGWTETVLHSFSSKPDGMEPDGALIVDSKGDLYGVTAGGGQGPSNGYGTVFEVIP